MEEEADIVVIGAGVAGLAAAQKLSSAEFKVVVLEARDRIGGRINTHFNDTLTVPVELGAEFVHGKPKETLDIVERGRIALAEVPNRHWYLLDQSLGALSRIFGISRNSIEAQLESSYTHNWRTDPF